MIVLGNDDFAVGMKLAGVKNSHVIKNREHALKLIASIDPKEFIITNISVVELVPELKEFKNMIALPDSVEGFSNIDDLKHIIKSVVGIELEVV